MNLKIDHLKSAVKLNLYFISDPQICLLFDFVYQCVFYMNSDYRTIAPYQSLERNHLFKRFQKYNLCVISWSERLCPSLLKIQNSTWHAEKNSRRMSVKHTDIERRQQEGLREDRLEPVSAMWPCCVVRPAVYSLLDSPTPAAAASSWQTDGSIISLSAGPPMMHWRYSLPNTQTVHH